MARGTVRALLGVGILAVALLLMTCTAPDAEAYERYIAVYLNPETLTWAYSTGDTLEFAKKQAAEACGSGCKFACWSGDACLALAIAKGGGKEGTCYQCEWSNSRREAARKALKNCRDRGCECSVVLKECYR